MHEQSTSTKQIRLKDYDYSKAGYYFITVCTNDRLNLFGKIVGVDGPVHPPVIQANQIGEIVYKCWNKINEIYENVKTDVFCLMPNHIHGIIVIDERGGHISETGGQSRPPLQKICHNEKDGKCKFRKTYTIDNRLIEKCNGTVFEFEKPDTNKLPDYMALLREFYPVRKGGKG